MGISKWIAAGFGVLATASSAGEGYSTPEDAVRGIEAAWTRKDLEAAVRSKDFREEARLMLQKINPTLLEPADILPKTAEVLEFAPERVNDFGTPGVMRLAPIRSWS
jgi:hypothetical protein